MSTRYRRISPTEWAYLAAARAFPPLAIQLWIRSEQLPAMESLEAALTRAAAANPGARLIRSGRWWLDCGRAPRLLELPGDEPLTLQHPLFRRPFADERREPQLEVIAICGAGLVFRCAHSLMDARGLLYFAEETARVLRGEPPLGTSRNISDHDYLRELAHPKRRGWPRGSSASPLGPADSKPGFCWESLQVADTPALNARLAAAITRLCLARAPDRSVKFLIPVDLRQADPRLRTTANMSNALMPEIAAGQPWSAFYQHTLEALARHDERAIEPLDTWVPWLPAGLLARFQRAAHRRCVRNDRYFFSAVLSHIGTVSLARLSSAEFVARSASFLPTDAPGVASTLVITQHDHGTEIMASAPAATGGNGRLARVLDELRKAVTESAPTLPELFAARVKASPDSRAVSDSNSCWTYAELDHRANAWARRLEDAGVNAGDRVAILAARSPEVVAALIGILRTGAAFVPLEPDWPRARIDYVIHDCQPAMIVTDSPDAALAELAPLLEIGTPLPQATREVARVAPHDPAYVIYTSGSSGQPKGVVVAHASLANYLQAARALYAPGAPPVYPLFTSLAFDLTQTALWLPLICGGELRIFAERDPLLAARAIAADRTLDSIKLTPSHLRLMCELGMQGSALRTFVVGGEALSTALAAETLSQCPGAAIFNEYGPTEATVGCIVHRFDPLQDRGAQVPIGQPLAGTHIRLLEESGEIVIGGSCLALGYLTPSADDRRFVVMDGQRAYRSGDLGSLVAGQYLYHGRADDQVKILGHRVELGEVDAAILAHPSVAQAAVAVNAGAANPALIAFVVWRAQPDADGLRAALAKLLPAYMVPGRIESVADLPLSTNGKIDKQQLLGVIPPPAAQPAPASGLQRELTQMLADQLGIAPSRLSPDRSLLEQGCDSLQLAIFLSRAADRHMSRESSDTFFANLADFIARPTLSRLTRVIERPA